MADSPPGYSVERKSDPSDQIFVKSFDGKSMLIAGTVLIVLAVTLNIDDFGKTILALKQQFYEKEGIEVQYQSLIYAGKPLRDGTPLFPQLLLM